MPCPLQKRQKRLTSKRLVRFNRTVSECLQQELTYLEDPDLHTHRVAACILSTVACCALGFSGISLPASKLTDFRVCLNWLSSVESVSDARDALCGLLVGCYAKNDFVEILHFDSLSAVATLSTDDEDILNVPLYSGACVDRVQMRDMDKLRPLILAVVEGKKTLPVWIPEHDSLNSQFLQDLKIPLVEGRRSLLLHHLDTPYRPFQFQDEMTMPCKDGIGSSDFSEALNSTKFTQDPECQDSVYSSTALADNANTAGHRLKQVLLARLTIFEIYLHLILKPPPDGFTPF
ncbi:hypothetical protein EUX98_g1972 [Antrodiella citrinella]|uniref:Uncharacterized protein n=1 Tax=Antrodiella citrinella TaxID=2447956 RepID=A0A4S4N063_9APHY|nr:hypothetical protein EUX98_g1972 [Antrodiella citrinella]